MIRVASHGGFGVAGMSHDQVHCVQVTMANSAAGPTTTMVWEKDAATTASTPLHQAMPSVAKKAQTCA